MLAVDVGPRDCDSLVTPRNRYAMSAPAEKRWTPARDDRAAWRKDLAHAGRSGCGLKSLAPVVGLGIGPAAPLADSIRFQPRPVELVTQDRRSWRNEYY